MGLLVALWHPVVQSTLDAIEQIRRLQLAGMSGYNRDSNRRDSLRQRLGLEEALAGGDYSVPFRLLAREDVGFTNLQGYIYIDALDEAVVPSNRTLASLGRFQQRQRRWNCFQADVSQWHPDWLREFVPNLAVLDDRLTIQQSKAVAANGGFVHSMELTGLGAPHIEALHVLNGMGVGRCELIECDWSSELASSSRELTLSRLG
jgi:hypothetical protein